MHLGRTGEAFFLGEEVEDGGGERSPSIILRHCTHHHVCTKLEHRH